MNSTPQRDAAEPQFPPGRILLTVRCHHCGYNLKGADPASACPECGTAVWPSLRPYVDSSAERLVLLANPKRTGAALVIVSGALLLSSLMLWWPYLSALGSQMQSPGAPLMAEAALWHYAIVGVLAGTAFAATFALQHPTGAAAPVEYRKGLVLARLGLVGWTLLHGVLVLHDAAVSHPVRNWYDFVQLDAARSLLRVGLDVSVLLMIVGFRPVEKFLARRSMPHRVGGASRQGFLPVFVLIIVILSGDLVRLVAWALDAAGLAGLLVDNAALIGMMLVLVGSVMITVSLLNLTIDSSRLARNLGRPLHRLEEIIG